MSRRHWWSTVRSQTTLVATGVVGAALVFAAIGLVWLVQARLVAADRSAAELRADDVLTLARAGDLPKLLSYPGEETGATQVVDESGAVIASTSNIAGESPISSDRPLPGQNTASIASGLPIGDSQRYVIVARTDSAARGVVTVLAAASLESADDTVDALAVALGVGIPGLMLAVALTTRVLIGRAFRPVAAITTEVADITQGDLHRRVPEPGTADEIDQLAATMNQMLGRLELASEQQRRFIADASHELRSPLASARTVLEVARLHPGTRDQLISAVDDALVDHGRLDTLVLDLLTLARLDGERGAMKTEPIDVAGLVGDVLERRSGQGTELTATGDSVLFSDPVLIERILTNLLDNAERHRVSRTIVALSAGAQFLELTVEDDGPGIAETDRERVFEPFTRMDEAREADHGTGLGLAIVRETVLSLGGTVCVDDGQSGGARFTVRIPNPPARQLRR